MGWLVAHEPVEAERWCNQLVRENAPLLRRLAIHALVTCANLRPKEKIDWLLTNTKLDDRPARHELFRALRKIYPQASIESRRDVIEAVLSFRWSGDKREEADKFTVRHHFDWLHWLNESAPDCELAKKAISNLLEKNPDLGPRKHPDLSYWIGDGEVISPQSPWSVEELLAKPVTAEWVHELAAFQPQELLGPDWEGLLCAVAEAARKDTAWAAGLAEQLKRELEHRIMEWTAEWLMWRSIRRRSSISRFSLLDRRGVARKTHRQHRQISARLDQE